MIPRRPSRRIMVGSVAVGGGAPVSIQSMTNTPTADAAATLAQIEHLAALGCEVAWRVIRKNKEKKACITTSKEN